MAKEKIIIVEDEFIVANDLNIILNKAGYRVLGIVASVEQARELIAIEKPDWVLLDIILKGGLNGIDLAWELKEMQIPYLYVSANTNQTILEAVKETNPYGFIVKPFREKDLLVMLDIARHKFNIEKGTFNVADVNPETEIERTLQIIGKSPSLNEVLDRVKIVAHTDTSVLILGESGTGKEKIAQAVHKLSKRREHKLVVVNCATLPHGLAESELFGHERGAFTGADKQRIGKFELADQGTLFLDEIGELPLNSQIKLLRVLQEKEIERLGGDQTIKVNVRVIAATNRVLEMEVAEGRFRLDLYYRLNVFPIALTPLRERIDDIEALAYHFLKKFNAGNPKPVTGISPVALSKLQSYSWPGNIRELEHLIEKNVLLSRSDCITDLDMPDSGWIPAPKQETEQPLSTLEEAERKLIIEALKRCNGKVFGSGTKPQKATELSAPRN